MRVRRPGEISDRYGVALVMFVFFFFKQKTAYEMPKCWSSDVCSSDLPAGLDDDRVPARYSRRVEPDGRPGIAPDCIVPFGQLERPIAGDDPGGDRRLTCLTVGAGNEIGRASCRERVEVACGSRTRSVA